MQRWRPRWHQGQPAAVLHLLTPRLPLWLRQHGHAWEGPGWRVAMPDMPTSGISSARPGRTSTGAAAGHTGPAHAGQYRRASACGRAARTGPSAAAGGRTIAQAA